MAVLTRLSAPSLSARLAAALQRHGVHYGWLVVGVTFVTLLGSAGVRSMPGV
jgi:hypothetical protein